MVKVIVQEVLAGIVLIAETTDHVVLRPLKMVCKGNVEELAVN